MHTRYLANALGMALLCGCRTPPSSSAFASNAPAGDLLTPFRFDAQVVYDEKGVLYPLPPCSEDQSHSQSLPLLQAGSISREACDRGAVLSYRVPTNHSLATRSFVYDNALAMIAHTVRAEYKEAQAIGNTLVALVLPSQGIGFSFSLEKPAFYNMHYLRSGSVAWVGYALAFYDLTTGENRYRTVAQRLADILLANRIASPDDPRDRLVLAGEGRWADHYKEFDVSYHATYCATEHQIDTYFFLTTLSYLDSTGRYKADAQELAARMMHALWLPAEGRFAVAVTSKGPDLQSALDAAGAWGVLFLLAQGDKAHASQALAYTQRVFATRVEGRDGFAPYAGGFSDYPGYDFSHTFFSEGTAGVALALLRMGRRQEALRIANTLRTLQREHGGGVPYAFPPSEDFPNIPAVGPTAWLAFLEMELAGRTPTVFAPTAYLRFPCLLTQG